jgi:hypothetical protein
VNANLFYVDLYNGRACDEKGQAIAFPDVVAGGVISYAIRFLEFYGAYTEKDQDIASLRVSIGEVDTRPVAGQYRLKIGSSTSVVGVNTTEYLDVAATSYEVSLALNALSAKSCAFYCVDVPGSVLIRRTDGLPQSLSVVSNRLVPVSFGRITGVEADGEWSYELRLTVAPLAFSDSADRVLPGAPTITTLVDGGTDTSGTVVWNEIQQLYVPPNFKGTYQLRYGDFCKTTLLDLQDGPAQLQTALNDMLTLPSGSALGTVTVTNPVKDYAHIEFGGDLAGADVEPLTVSVFNSPQGDWTFELPLNTSALFFALREEEELSVPFEGEADFYIDPLDHAAGFITRKLWQTTIKIKRPQIMPDMAVTPSTDWLRVNPVDYVPFTASQIVTGPQIYSTTIGDAGATSFTITHGMNTMSLANLVVRANTAQWSVLEEGSDYTATITSNNEVELSFDDAPAANGLLVYVQSAPVARQWDAHTHTREQVVGLTALLDNLLERIMELEFLLPRAGTAGVVGGNSISFSVPGVGEVLPDVNALDSLQTLASQIIINGSGQSFPDGTALADQADQLAKQNDAIKNDPDALPANVLYRMLIPGVGAIGQNGRAEIVSGTDIVPAVPAVPATPAVWPFRSTAMVASQKWPLLLPAVTAVSFGTALAVPSTLVAGSVYVVGNSQGLTLPGGGGRKSQKASLGQYFATDGRCFYLVNKEENTYFPTEMDRELWRVFLGDSQFPDGAVLSVRGELRARMLGDFFDDDARGVGRVDAGAQFMLKCEAVPVALTTALGVAATPVLLGETRMTISPALETFAWSLSIRRQAIGGMVSSWSAYRKSAVGGDFGLPAVIRLRLTSFDMDNTSPDPRGQIALVMPPTNLEVTI